MRYRNTGYIATFHGDFAHHVFDTWQETARYIIGIGHGFWDGNYLSFDPGWDIEEITIH